MKPVEFGNIMFGESKSTCTACSATWYSEHFKNGFCYECQKNGTMDSTMSKQRMIKNISITVKFLIFISIILSVFALSSCENRPSYIEGRKTDDSSGIHYIKDSRTGLCFAERGSGNTYSFTCVPCSEKVENLIKTCNSCGQ
jgi:hypothetical protein